MGNLFGALSSADVHLNEIEKKPLERNKSTLQGAKKSAE